MNATVEDLRPTIVPKSDQLNAEQLLSGPLTIRVTEVRVSDSAEQPVVVHYEGDEGRPYKPCKTTRKLLVHAWGENGRAWAGRWMTLYNDPTIRFGGSEVGGIRISHLSHIERGLRVSLTSTKGKKALHEVHPLQIEEAPTLAQVLAAIEAAATGADMKAARAMAERLQSADDIKQAVDAYKERAAALKAQSVNNQNHPNAWHDGVDAALAVIRGA